MQGDAKCPSHEDLERLVSERLSSEAVVRIEEHVGSCDNCSESIRLINDQFDVTPPPIVPVVVPTTPILNESLGFLTAAEQPGILGMFGSFRVLSVLGRSGIGVVLEAEDVKLNRRIALKAIRPPFSDQTDIRQRFLHEAQAISSLDHENIVNIHQIGDDVIPYLTMPLLEGETLADRLRVHHTLPLYDALRIARETAAGLGAAHQQGVIHRDIKPENIWLERENDRVKLLDFGLARDTTGEGHRTTNGATFETSDDVLLKSVDSGQSTQKSDLFGLGCVLHAMLTGERPFAIQNPKDVSPDQTTRIPTPPHHVSSDVPEELSHLVMKLLDQSPADRPLSTDDVVADIGRMEKKIHNPETDQFQKRLIASGLVSETQLTEFLTSLPEDTTPCDAESLAR
jgi:serine/threonine protein kinase